MINKVIISGIISNDLEFKTVAAGSTLLKINLCSKRDYVNGKTKQVNTDTVYINIDCWGQVAESGRNFRKGDMILVEGNLKSSSFVDKSGTERKGHIIQASLIELLGHSNEEEQPPVSQSMNRKMQILDELPF